MSILLAVIGRYRSGKTALCQRFEQGGVIRLPIESMIEQLIQDHPNYEIWQYCLQGRYEKVLDVIPILEDGLLLRTLMSMLLKQECQYACYVELPGFINIECLRYFMDHFSYIIAVDCPDKIRDRYMRSLPIDHNQLALLKRSGCDRSHYVSIATDVFLNTVEESYIDWVAHKLLSSYQLSDTYLD